MNDMYVTILSKHVARSTWGPRSVRFRSRPFHGHGRTAQSQWGQNRRFQRRSQRRSWMHQVPAGPVGMAW